MSVDKESFRSPKERERQRDREKRNRVVTFRNTCLVCISTTLYIIIDIIIMYILIINIHYAKSTHGRCASSERERVRETI